RGVKYRFGRAVALRSLPDEAYDRERKELRHRGPFLPIILEACREEELSYEYRDGAASYGAFTFCLARVLRETRSAKRNPTFETQVVGHFGYWPVPFGARPNGGALAFG